MSRLVITALALACATLSGAACSNSSPTGPTGPGADAASLAAGSEAASRTTVPLTPFPSGPVIAGTSSSLVRTDAGISMTVRTNGLVSGSVYTVWFVIFNTPDDCVGGCGVDDVFANLGTPSLRLGGGHVVGDSGAGNFGGQLSVGNTGGPACANNPAILGSCGPGLLDARAAEVHLVIRSHGPAIPELVSDQLSSFLGGCSVNGCANVQAAIHHPVE